MFKDVDIMLLLFYAQ